MLGSGCRSDYPLIPSPYHQKPITKPQLPQQAASAARDVLFLGAGPRTFCFERSLKMAWFKFTPNLPSTYVTSSFGEYVCCFFSSNHLHKIHIYPLRTRKKTPFGIWPIIFGLLFRCFFPFEAPWHLTSSQVWEGGWTIFPQFLGPPKSYGWHIKARSARWWFQFFFVFIPTWGNHLIWLLFFRWVETSTCLYLLERVSPETNMAVEHRKKPKL